MADQQSQSNNALRGISDAGVSIWLDDLDRHRIESGNLANLIAHRHVVGVTTNPSIFEKALTSGVIEYQEQIEQLRSESVDTDAAIRQLTVRDVQSACDLFRSTYDATKGQDGRVSIEVDPRLAHDTEGTMNQALELWQEVNRPNAMIKIPATDAGLPAIAHALAHGISVNVTLIFSVARYKQVIDAWLTGLEQAQAKNLDLSTIHSVASFFISRVDVLIDSKLDAMQTTSAKQLRGKAAIANAHLAWQEYLDTLAGDRWKALQAAGAIAARPLWASTGVKDPAYDDTRYVIELVAPGCVNTMPESTLNAVADHGQFKGDTVSGKASSAQQVWDDLKSIGIEAKEVFSTLESEGVDKFIAAWNQLRDGITKVLAG